MDTQPPPQSAESALRDLRYNVCDLTSCATALATKVTSLESEKDRTSNRKEFKQANDFFGSIGSFGFDQNCDSFPYFIAKFNHRATAKGWNDNQKIAKLSNYFTDRAFQLYSASSSVD